MVYTECMEAEMHLDEYGLFISDWVKEKLSMPDRNITEIEVEEAFYNSSGKYLIDIREEHKTHPSTYWFISETYEGRLLKICFIIYHNKRIINIKTAYEPDDTEVRIYEDS